MSDFCTKRQRFFSKWKVRLVFRDCKRQDTLTASRLLFTVSLYFLVRGVHLYHKYTIYSGTSSVRRLRFLPSLKGISLKAQQRPIQTFTLNGTGWDLCPFGRIATGPVPLHSVYNNFDVSRLPGVPWYGHIFFL